MKIEPERVCPLNQQAERNDKRASYVLYWMQQSQRLHDNPALNYAVAAANRLKVPLLVAFGLTTNFPEANGRHYAFMLEGLRETAESLRQLGAGFILREGSPDTVALSLADRAALLVCDVGYLRIQRQWRERLAREAPCAVIAVEGDVVVPVQTASDHEEYAARTLRPKIHRLLSDFITIPPLPKLAVPFREPLSGGLDDQQPGAILNNLALDKSVLPFPPYSGGRSAALKRLRLFTETHLPEYDLRRNDPGQDYGSRLSAPLHFGQISPREIALAIRKAAAPESAKEAFLEELIVRRELSMNYVWYNTRYDHYESLPAWARDTLDSHRQDSRPTLYEPEQMERAQTGDPFWNAAQQELLLTGCMHSYMRMYWGKKILEWSPAPEQAWETAMRLNNRYELDGRDPNGFAGIAWCFGKHDRPWTERPIFGKVRYMNAAGLQRKFDMAAYLDRIQALTQS